MVILSNRDQFFEKLWAEYGASVNRINAKSYYEIIEAVEEATCKMEIFTTLGSSHYTEDEYAAMLKIENPLDTFYEDWLEADTSDMEDMSGCIYDTFKRETDLENGAAVDEENYDAAAFPGLAVREDPNDSGYYSFEERTAADDKSDDAGAIQGVTEVRMSARDFESKMKELLPGASARAIEQLITYAGELDGDDTHPKEAFFSETYVSYTMTLRKYGSEITSAVLNICEDFCLNPWEISDAARLIKRGASPEKVQRIAVGDGLDFKREEWDELEAGLAALQNGTLDVPIAVDKAQDYQEQNDAPPSQGANPRSSKKAGKAEKPKTLEAKLNAAKEKAKTQDAQNNGKKNRKRDGIGE